MSNSRSDVTDPLRPADHADGTPVAQPVLGVVGWLRWGWRQLTSMRTALVLLLLLAIAAIPGSIVPQRTADPNGVTQFRADHPDIFPVLDGMQLFDVYSSAWFSAIYILLFISLIGCVIPRTKHHWKALRALPPRTPARLSRLDDHAEGFRALPEGADGSTDAMGDATVQAQRAVEIAQAQLRKAGYRVERYDTPARGSAPAVASVSAERGYARETGNLVFHAALVGVLLSVGVGGGLTYTGQTVIVEGDNFVNSLALGYTSFNPGRFVDTEHLPPYSLTLDSFDVSYVPPGQPGQGMAGSFAANLTTQEPGHDPEKKTIRVNHPVDMAGDRVYLMGNGYAPTITVRNPAGDVVFREDVAFLPQDTNMTSLGVVKVPDGLAEQVGLVGFFYPTAATLHTGAFTSAYPALASPLLTLDVYAGDLGINDGTPRNVYALDTSGMTQLTGRSINVKSLELTPGQTVALPNGLGSVTFDDASASGAREQVKRYVSLSVHRDVGAPFVLAFAVIALLGLLAALFVPRRRMWVKATPDAGGIRLEYAGLARGEDPAIAVAVADLQREHEKGMDAAGLGRSEASATPAEATDGPSIAGRPA
ncbi:cytochrome c biogenesis protein ResB [Microbacterium dextranolyticum]|uniref:Cytochrome c biogenesis protein ResB n=1 Tax=Microbacterium dextranolyticum TaxID=36806 RepID=A0A9W6HL25_9MICO|nr:cytochrome c biogenesis protein ResB [Microbacterium dextranolyticum]MBM7463937.1 cytochrome c biogenesis protein [Microbacterium dextranolyticum]GLJ95018.1 cytochrome c biogenesis protein ResB [Microbacterium dextranolyticum]